MQQFFIINYNILLVYNRFGKRRKKYNHEYYLCHQCQYQRSKRRQRRQRHQRRHHHRHRYRRHRWCHSHHQITMDHALPAPRLSWGSASNPTSGSWVIPTAHAEPFAWGRSTPSPVLTCPYDNAWNQHLNHDHSHCTPGNCVHHWFPFQSDYESKYQNNK